MRWRADVARGFWAIAQAALKLTHSTPRLKESIALPILRGDSLRQVCCLYAETAVNSARDDVMATAGMAIYMDTGPSVIYAAQAVEAFDHFTDAKSGVPLRRFLDFGERTHMMPAPGGWRARIAAEESAVSKGG